jgi:hypothetical protein
MFSRGLAVQVHLNQRTDFAPCRYRTLSQRLHQPSPINRMHEICVSCHRLRLVGLKLPDEMPP